jgi:hypothetical protein
MTISNIAILFLLLLKWTSTLGLLQLQAPSLSFHSNDVYYYVAGGRRIHSLSQTVAHQKDLINSKGRSETRSCLPSHDMEPLCDNSDFKIQSSSSLNQIQNDDPFETSNHTNGLTSHDDDENDDNDNSSTNKEDIDYSKIRKGEIYVQHNFLNSTQVALLRKDIAQLQQHRLTETAAATTTRTTRTKLTFQPSGLSNRVAGDRNVFGFSDRLTCTITPDLLKGDEKLSSMRLVVEEKMEDLKVKLQVALSSPKPKPIAPNGRCCAFVNDAATEEDKHRNDCRSSSSLPVDNRERTCRLEQLELAEMYYSISPKGSHLPRHQDERHEETKGNKGWINDTRRSISWLIYLNDDDWSRGTTCTRNDTANENEDVHDEGNQNLPATATARRTLATTNQSNQSAGHGGELRAYIRKCCPEEHVQCGSHDGDIQVGWLRIESSPLSSSSSSPSSSSTRARDSIEYEPIFLDCWVKMPAPKSHTFESNKEEGGEKEEGYHDNDDSLEWQPMSALYRIRRKELSPEAKYNKPNPLAYDNPRKPLREYLSLPFGPNSPSWPSEQNLEPTDFAWALALQLTSEDHRRRFVGVEDITHYSDAEKGKENGDINSNCDDLHVQQQLEVIDVVPAGGTLVLFDSVTVPHEVLEVTKGTRLAIAGWYHEKQQDFPEWYGT